MFTSIIGLLTDIIPASTPARSSRPHPNATPGASDLGVRTLTELAPIELPEGQDRRDFFVGRWECGGTKTVQVQVLPYNGTMRNSWALDNTWLVIEFKEEQKAPGDSFSEDQYWGFAQETSVQTRPMMTSLNGFALVTSGGWINNTSSWTGTYTISGTVLDLTETVTILSQNQFRMAGEMSLNGVSLGGYDVICTRKGNPHPNGTPTI